MTFSLKQLPCLCILLCACAAVLFPEPATAQQSAPAASPSRLEISGGVYDINDSDTTGEARIEYKWGKPLIWEVRPFAGLMVSGDWAIYGYGGLAYDWQFARNWYLIPSFAAGLYEDGNGKDLGSTIEFRSQVGVSYEFANRHRLGVYLSHISNASISDNNPGTEEVVLTYSVPVE